MKPKLAAKLISDSRRYLGALSQLQRHNLSEYQEASWINDILRNRDINEERNAGYLRLVNDLDEILRNAPTAPEDLRIYRSAPRTVYPGRERGYLSGTIDKRVADNWPSWMGETDNHTTHNIDIMEGTPYVMPLDLMPEYLNQKEIILPRDSLLLQEPSTGVLNYLRGKYKIGGRVR